MSAKIEGVPALPGWVNITEASEILGETRQQTYKVARRGGFKTLHQLGSKPAYVISTDELKTIAEERRVRAAEEAAEEKVAE